MSNFNFLKHGSDMEQWSKFAYQFTNGFFGIFSTNKKSSYAPMMAKKCVKNRISYAADD